MARIRSIKPEYWQDFRLAEELTRDQRLFYIGLWNEADDEGRFMAHPRRLLGAIFPYDRDLTDEFIEDSLSALARTGRLVRYEVDGEPYGQLTKFRHHQRINRPSPSKLPSPPTSIEDSVKPHGGISEASIPRAHTREQGTGNREDVLVHPSAGPADDGFEQFWKNRPRRDGSDPKRAAQRAWNARLREGIAASAMLEAGERYRRWCEAKGKVRTEHVMRAATFLGDPEHFTNPWAVTNGRDAAEKTPADRKQQLREALAMVLRHDPDFAGGLPDLWDHAFEVPRRDYGLWDEVLREAGLDPIPEGA